MAADSKSSGKRKNEDVLLLNHEEFVIKFTVLEEQELARHRLRQLKETYNEQNYLYQKYVHRHYLIITLCGVVSLLGLAILCLKLTKEEDEDLLVSFQTVQSIFASIVSGGSLIAQGGSILFSKLKEPSDDDSKNDPKDVTIRLVIEGDLGGKIEEMTKQLRIKTDLLEHAKAWQAILATMASLIALVIVAIEFFGLIPNVSKGIGLDIILVAAGIHFMWFTFIFYTIFSYSRDKLEYSKFILFIVLLPYACCVDVLNWDAVKKWFKSWFNPKRWRKYDEEDEHWLKDAYVSPKDKSEISALLRGLDPYKCQMKVEKFCTELKLVNSKPNKPTESATSTEPTNFLELIKEIESKAKQKVIWQHFLLGEALFKWLRPNDNQNNQNTLNQFVEDIPNRFVKDIVKIFSSIDPYTKEQIRIHCFEYKKGLNEYFEKNPRNKPAQLSDEEVCNANDALKIYAIFNNDNGIGKEKIEQIKTSTASDIGKYTKTEIEGIIENKKANDEENGNNDANDANDAAIVEVLIRY